VTSRPSLGDENGTTLVEVLVATSIGLVVLMALTMGILAVMHGTARVSARVHATQNARIVTTNVMEELHSACLSPRISPIQTGSSGTSISFVHAASNEGAQAVPKPVLTTISLTGTTLSQSDYAWTSGASSKEWTFAATPTTRQLTTGVGPAPSTSSIFFYFTYTKGGLSPTPLTTPLTAESAATTVQVRMTLTATPGKTTVTDKGAAATIQDGATLRLTPPSFNEEVPGPPCQ
jgi:Tfp pilus assembly protein PilW